MNRSFLFLPDRKFLIMAMMTCLVSITGCTTLQPVNIAEASGRTAIVKGDTVVVTTDSGQVHTFKVVDITADGLHGRKLSVPYADMRLLQIQRIDMKRTILLTVSIIGLGVIASDDDSGGGGGGY